MAMAVRERMPTFVLELPDEERVSEVVTGWESGNADKSSYDQSGGVPTWQNS